MQSATQQPDAAALRRQLGYITAEELFALLGIALGTGRNRQSAGSLPPHYKIGREKLYKLAEVEAWIKRRRVTRAAA
jgi:predicted DNA-binding transcriptional regulator AlpA